MNNIFRMSHPMLELIHADLSRPHRFTYERVGFIACRQTKLMEGAAFLAESYYPVEDEDYLESSKVGALMGPAAIRKALQLAYNESFRMFHVHRHNHHGKPRFSKIDLLESAKFVPDFWKVCPDASHGAIVLSLDSASGLAWDPIDGVPKPLAQIQIIGRPPFRFWR